MAHIRQKFTFCLISLFCSPPGLHHFCNASKAGK
jgi:hypothetical protein